MAGLRDRGEARRADATADVLVRAVGGADNVRSLEHCVTRLRLVLRDDGAADDDAVRALEPVQEVVGAGGQYQVVIGPDVAELDGEVRRALAAAPAGDEPPASEPDPGSSDNGATSTDATALISLFQGPSAPRPGAWYRRGLDGFLGLVQAVLGPLLWPLVGAGLLKGHAGFLLHLGILGERGGTVALVLTSAADGALVLLPVGVAITTARYLRSSEFTAFALAAALLLSGLLGQAAPGWGPTDTEQRLAVLTGLQIPNAGAFVPVVIAVWVAGHLERWLRLRTPRDLADPLTPAATLLIMVPLLTLVIAPVAGELTEAIATVTTALAHHTPWLLGAVLGATWQLLVLRGLHWILVPLMLNELVETGSSPLLAVLLPAVLAQGAAVLGVRVRARRTDLRTAATPAARSAILAGVTEAGLYGLSIPLRRPFAAGCVGGAAGGALVLMAGGASEAPVLPSLVALPAYLMGGSPWGIVGGTLLAMLIAVVGTAALPLHEERVSGGDAVARPEPIAQSAPSPAAAEPDRARDVATPVPAVTVLAPAAGRLVPLDEVPDEVLGSGMMGPGVGIIPSDGRVLAPVTGTVSATVPSLHGWGVRTDDGVEVLVHVGVRTVGLHGEGFAPHAELGQHVEAGDPLVDADLAVIEAAGLSTATAVLVISREHADGVSVIHKPGTLAAGEAVIAVEHPGPAPHDAPGDEERTS